MAETCQWTGGTGTQYKYLIYPIGTNWRDVGGNYIFAKVVSGRWSPVYIGETDSFKNRLPSHNKLLVAQRNGATHIHVRVNEDGADRLVEETDLLANYTTPCND